MKRGRRVRETSSRRQSRLSLGWKVARPTGQRGEGLPSVRKMGEQAGCVRGQHTPRGASSSLAGVKGVLRVNREGRGQPSGLKIFIPKVLG